MATIRDRYILEIDTQGGVRGLGSAEQAVARLDGSLRGIRNAAGVAVGALAGIGAVNLAQNAIETYTEFETLTTQIATYTGGLENARAELQRLEALSVELPQDLNDLAAAFTILTRTGVDTSAESLRAFSDIAAANGKSLEQLAEAVADGMTGEFERFKEFGIKVSKEGDNLVARIGDQQVAVAGSAEQLVSQLVSLGEEGGRFFGAGAANAETLSQSFSNLQGAVSIAERSFVEGLKPGLQEVVEAITTLATENSGLLTSFGALIGEGLAALPEAFAAVYEAVQPLTPLFELLGTLVMDVLWPALQALFEVLGTLATALQPIVEGLIPAFQSGLEFIQTAIQGTIEFISRMIERLQALWATAREIAGGVGDAFNTMSDSVTGAAEDAYNGVTGWFGDMYDYVVGNSVVPDMVREVLGEFDFMNQGMNASVRQGALGVAQGFDGIAANISDGFNRYVSQALNGVNSQVSQISNSIFGQLQGLASSLDQSFGGVFSSIGNIFSGGGGGGGNFLGGLVDNLFGSVNDLFGGFFADGGRLAPGKFGVVGERGPELITGPANITPMDQLGGTIQYVTYNINATDARSFRDLLARDPSYIHALAQTGARRVPGRF